MRGWSRLVSFTRPADNIVTYIPWKLERAGAWQLIDVEWQRRRGELLIRIAPAASRDEAAALTGCHVGVSREELPAPIEDEFYWRDLVGLTVRNPDGEVLGSVVDLMETGANDVLVVEPGAKPGGAGKQRPLLIPFVRERVLTVDLEQRIILADWSADFHV